MPSRRTVWWLIKVIGFVAAIWAHALSAQEQPQEDWIDQLSPGQLKALAMSEAQGSVELARRLALLMARNKCWTNFPARLIFSNGSTKPDQANTVSAGID